MSNTRDMMDAIAAIERWEHDAITQETKELVEELKNKPYRFAEVGRLLRCLERGQISPMEARDRLFQIARKDVKGIYYMDMTTGEYTEDHRSAVREFFNAGHNVGLYACATNKLICAWEH